MKRAVFALALLGTLPACRSVASECAQLRATIDLVPTQGHLEVVNGKLVAFREGNAFIDSQLRAIEGMRFRHKPIDAVRIGYRDALATLRRTNVTVDEQLARVDLSGSDPAAQERVVLVTQESMRIDGFVLTLTACLREQSDECTRVRAVLEKLYNPAPGISVRELFETAAKDLDALELTTPARHDAARALAEASRRAAPTLAVIKPSAKEVMDVWKNVASATSSRREAQEGVEARIAEVRAVCK